MTCTTRPVTKFSGEVKDVFLRIIADIVNESKRQVLHGIRGSTIDSRPTREAVTLELLDLQTAENVHRWRRTDFDSC